MNSLRVLILDDGVKGHLRQCEAIAYQLENLVKNRKISYLELSTEILQMKVSAKKAKKVADVIKVLPRSLWFFVIKRWLRQLVNPNKLYSSLDHEEYDVVISAFGIKTSVLNLLLCYQWKAKSIVLMNARGLLKHFDLAFLHRHSTDYEAPNVVKTLGAPNLVSEDRLQYFGSQIKAANADDGPNVGVLIGGNYKTYELSSSKVATLLQQLELLKSKKPFKLWVSLSRRTPDNVQAQFEAFIKGKQWCPFFINKERLVEEGSVEKILSSCSVVVVSPDSVSMISEAANSNAHVLSWKDPEFLDDEHARFVENILSAGHLQMTEVDRLAPKIEELLDSGKKQCFPDDHDRIQQALFSLMSS